MKRLLPFLLAVLLLGSCALLKSGEPSDEDVSTDPDEPVLTKQNIELTVWVEPGAGEGFIKQAAAAFNQKYPNIAIRVTGVESSEVLRRVRTASAQGGCADLFVLPHMELRSLADDLFILPARDQTKVKNTVFPACAQAAAVNGVLYGYPVSSETTALIYNKRLIQERDIPSTWEELIAFSKGFNDGERAGFVMPVGSAHHNAPFLTAWSNRPFGPAGDDPRAPNFSSLPAFEGMEVFQNLKSIVSLSVEELTVEAAERLFASGKAAMCIAGSWNVSRFSGVDFGVVPLPAFEPDNECLSMIFARVMTVSAYSPWPDEASAFADFLLTEEMQALQAELTGDLPSVEMTIRLPAYAAGFNRQMQNAFAAPSLPEAAGYWTLFNAAAARIWEGGNVQAEMSAASHAFFAAEEEGEEEQE